MKPPFVGQVSSGAWCQWLREHVPSPLRVFLGLCAALGAQQLECLAQGSRGPARLHTKHPQQLATLMFPCLECAAGRLERGANVQGAVCKCRQRMRRNIHGGYE